MSAPLTRLDLEQFAALLRQTTLTRKIVSIHLHHTWRPNHAGWRGLATLEAIRRYHIEERGFRDIAQHLTIDPAGGIWTGRDFNHPPASSYGTDPVTGKSANGNASAGPIAIELVGDFDDGKDRLDGPQRTATLQVLACLIKRFNLTADTIVAHHEMDAGKSCPGTALWAQSKVDANRAQSGARQSILTDALLQALAAASADPALPDAQAQAGGRATPAGVRAIANSASTAWEAGCDEGELPEDPCVLDVHTRETERALTANASRGAIDARYEAIAAHAINTAQGLLFEDRPRWTLRNGGRYTTSETDIRSLIERRLHPFIKSEIERQSGPPTVRIMLHAHGGLVDEECALEYAHAHHSWWKANHVYPFFMIWETGFLETLLGHRRALADGARAAPFDWLLEQGLGPLGALLWKRMKRNARLCSARDWDAAGGDNADFAGVAGGARVFARLLLDAIKAHATLGVQFELHAVGHSAGSIFHAYFLPMLLEEIAQKRVPNTRIKTLSFLAPALTIELFNAQLRPLIPAQIGSFSMFTMDRERELDDDVVHIYRKSLLYFVRNACEPDDAPILGLQESVRGSPLWNDQIVGSFFDAADLKNPAAVYWSRGGSSPASAPTAARHHGDFDNNAHTMTSVLALVLGATPTKPVAYEAYTVGVDASIWRNRALQRTLSTPERALRPVIAARTATGGSPYQALCIGVDAYPNAPLRGCVNDSRSWGRAFASFGYQVSALENAQATRAGVETAIRELLEQTPDGGTALIQFAGHGTQFEDQNGDEDDGFDEAYVPVDYLSAGCVLDDDLYDWLSAHARRVDICLFFDTCHSGSASRFAPIGRAARGLDERARFLPANAQMQAAQRSAERRRGLTRSQRRALRGDTLLPWLHLAACQDTEYAYETGDSGDFTGATVPLLQRAVSEGWNAERVLREARAAMGPNLRQHPQLQPTAAARLRAPLIAAPTRTVGTSADSAALTPAQAASPDAQLALAAQLIELAVQLLRRPA